MSILEQRDLLIISALLSAPYLADILFVLETCKYLIDVCPPISFSLDEVVCIKERPCMPLPAIHPSCSHRFGLLHLASSTTAGLRFYTVRFVLWLIGWFDAYER